MKLPEEIKNKIRVSREHQNNMSQIQTELEEWCNENVSDSVNVTLMDLVFTNVDDIEETFKKLEEVEAKEKPL